MAEPADFAALVAARTRKRGPASRMSRALDLLDPDMRASVEATILDGQLQFTDMAAALTDLVGEANIGGKLSDEMVRQWRNNQ